MYISELITQLITLYGNSQSFKYLRSLKEQKASGIEEIAHTLYVLYEARFNSTLLTTIDEQVRRVDEYSVFLIGEYVNASGIALTQYNAQTRRLIAAERLASIFRDEPKYENMKVLSPEELKARLMGINVYCFNGKLTLTPVNKQVILLNQIPVIMDLTSISLGDDPIELTAVMLADDAKINDYYDAILYGYGTNAFNTIASEMFHTISSKNVSLLIEYIAVKNHLIPTAGGAYPEITNEKEENGGK